MHFSSALAEILPDGSVRYRKMILRRGACLKAARCALTNKAIRPRSQAWRPTHLIREHRISVNSARNVWYCDKAVMQLLAGVGAEQKEFLNLFAAIYALQTGARSCPATYPAAAAHAAASAPTTPQTENISPAQLTPSRAYRLPSRERQ